jgi:hypothetical protein
MTEPAKHWQVDAVAQALQLQWLMCGLLAISACHLVSLSGDETLRESHRVQSNTFSRVFFIGLAETDDALGNIAADDLTLAAQMSCILRCVDWKTETLPSALPACPDRCLSG